MAGKRKIEPVRCTSCGETAHVFSYCPQCPLGPFCEPCRNAHDCGQQRRLPGIQA